VRRRRVNSSQAFLILQNQYGLLPLHPLQKWLNVSPCLPVTRRKLLEELIGNGDTVEHHGILVIGVARVGGKVLA
jgi:hypothetical protein